MNLKKKTYSSINPRLPQQEDGNSCGVFLVMIVAYYLKIGRFPSTKDFSNESSPDLRLYLQHTLIEEKQKQVQPVVDLTCDDPDEEEELILESRRQFSEIEDREMRSILELQLDPTFHNMSNREQNEHLLQTAKTALSEVATNEVLAALTAMEVGETSPLSSVDEKSPAKKYARQSLRDASEDGSDKSSEYYYSDQDEMAEDVTGD
jgi:Ulp1 family protease